MSRLRKFRQDDRGVALIEFTVMLPVLFSLIFGLIEFGRYFYQKQTAEKGVKSAARYVSRIVDRTGCPPTGAAYSDAVEKAKSVAITGSFEANAPPTLTNWASESLVNVSVDCVNNAASGGIRPWRGERDQLPVITVSTTFDFNDIGLLNYLGVDPLEVNASHQELFIGG